MKTLPNSIIWQTIWPFSPNWPYFWSGFSQGAPNLCDRDTPANPWERKNAWESAAWVGITLLAGQTLIPILSQIELKFNAEQAHYTMCWISNEREGSERMGGRGSVAKHSHKLQAADQTQANSTAAGKKLSWFSQDLAKNSQLLKKWAFPIQNMYVDFCPRFGPWGY